MSLLHSVFSQHSSIHTHSYIGGRRCHACCHLLIRSHNTHTLSMYDSVCCNMDMQTAEAWDQTIERLIGRQPLYLLSSCPLPCLRIYSTSFIQTALIVKQLMMFGLTKQPRAINPAETRERTPCLCLLHLW